MAFSADAKALALTIQSLYGDILDLPMLAPKAPTNPNSSSNSNPNSNLKSNFSSNLNPSPNAIPKHTPTQQIPPPPHSASESLALFADEIRYCEKCLYHCGRHNLVFGRGLPEGSIAFVGDFPSDQDDAIGQPFSDDAGDLLHKMILAMKLKPEHTYLTCLSKCRPPKGAQPEQDRFEHEEEHLKKQFQFLGAKFIVAMGDAAARTLARSESPLRVLRGQIFDWEDRRVFCTHHPRDLIHSPAKKKEAWDDLRSVMRAMGIV